MRSTTRHRRIAVLGVVIGLVVLVPLGAALLTGGLPRLGDLFAQEEVDRSEAPLLVALQDVAEFRAATGTLQVLVDLERDNPNLPAVISGERTTFFATGSVDAVVDFAALGPEQVVTSGDRRTVEITLPAPRLTDAVVDPAQSRVVGRERGIVQRLESIFEDLPDAEQELYVLAEEKIDAAARDTDLVARAEGNTRDMLGALAGSLGYEQVTVVFEAPEPAQPD